MSALDTAIWPEREAGSLLAALGAHNRVPPSAAGGDALDIGALCRIAGLEAQRMQLRGSDIRRILRSLSPGVIVVEGKGLLGVLQGGRHSARLLVPGYETVSVPHSAIIDLLAESARAGLAAKVGGIVSQWELSPADTTRAADALSAEGLRDCVIGIAWQLRSPEPARFRRLFFSGGIQFQLTAFACAFAVELALMLGGWYMVGQTGLRSGPRDFTWFAGWAGLLAASIPAHALTVWLQGRLALAAGKLLKQRLMTGVLRLDNDSLRRQGVGHLLGRVIESEVLETSAISGGLSTVLAFIELAAALAVMTAGMVPMTQPLGFVAWILVVAAIAQGYARARARWTDSRLRMTHLLVENLAGHRTRMAQQLPERWHDGEDQLSNAYARSTRTFDAAGANLLAAPSGVWLCAGLLMLLPVIAAGNGDTVAFGTSLGAVVLGAQALGRLANGFAQLSGVWVAWRHVRGLFQAANKLPEPGLRPSPLPKGDLALEVRDMTYRYAPDQDPVLDECNLRIHYGDRVLLEGPSGGGKSTLAAIIGGLRRPSTGTVLAGGYSLSTLGEREWKHRVASAPQYHENHIISAPLAFNLLMGRSWPPTEEDLREAQTVAEELGLGPLIARMPGGIMQLVGDTGWQLSQGERSRVFIARALLQNTEMIVLDESFASLDPANVLQCVETVRRRARSLLVVAHP